MEENRYLFWRALADTVHLPLPVCVSQSSPLISRIEREKMDLLNPSSGL